MGALNLVGEMRTYRKRVASVCTVPLVVIVVLLTLVTPASAEEPPPPVVMVGVPGLLWTDVDAEDTPALWNLVPDSGAASMTARSAGAKTCPDDAWASMSSGNRARSNYAAGATCTLGSLIGPPQHHADGTWRHAGFDELDSYNTGVSFQAPVGTLADTLGCVAAIGPGASVAAAHPDGTVDRYRADLPDSAEDMADHTSDCAATIVDPQTPVHGDHADTRADSAAQADAAVAGIIDTLPDDAIVMIAGISDAKTPVNLHPALLRAPDYAGHWMSSATTRRDGYVQLVDIAPTIVSLSSGESGPTGMIGQPMLPGAERGSDTAGTVYTGINANRSSQLVPPMSDGYYSTITILGLIIIAAAVVLCRVPATPRRTRLARLLLPAALLAGSLPVATLLVNAIPWWRIGNPAATLWGLIAVIAIAVAVIAWRGPWRRHPLGPAMVVAAVTAIVLGVDPATGSFLQFNSLTGYSAITGARFTGMGNYAFGVYAAAAIMAVIYLSARFQRWVRTITLVVGAAAAILVIGMPQWGNDVGGVIALTPAFILAAIHASGQRLSPQKIAGSLAAGAVVISALMIADYMRPTENQTHLGRFVAEVLNGAAADTLMRKGLAALGTVSSSPLTLLVIGGCVAIPLLWRTKLLRSILRDYPIVLSVGIGVACVGVLGFAFNDSGIAVPAFALALAAPLFATTAAVYAMRPQEVQVKSSSNR